MTTSPLEATLTGLNHLDTFGWVGSFSGAYNLWPLTRPKLASHAHSGVSWAGDTSPPMAEFRTIGESNGEGRDTRPLRRHRTGAR